MRPELLSIRAINQYRRRDILAYVGLRYYLENNCALNDVWSKNISTHLVSTRSSPAYFRSYHFKELIEDDSVSYRNIYIPGPNEILAESALLYECSIDPAFKALPCVYSYHFPERNSKEGMFQSYFSGFQEREKSIATFCNDLKGTVVHYTDIQKFYPTISADLALSTWRSACDLSGISSTYRDLGELILADHKKASTTYDEGCGVLTGPMFSHLVASLVLARIDSIMYEKMKKKYWRYVDDIVLVGDIEQVTNGRQFLNSLLSEMGFSLHDGGKDFKVDSIDWLKGANDFNVSDSKLWIALVANIKRFLVANPDQKNVLARAFLENEINFPLLDYSDTVMESSYLEKLSDWLAKYSWAPKSVRALNVDELIADAIQIREIYQNRINSLLEGNSDIKGYERKRLLSKLRFYAGRLIYLATSEVLSSVGSALIAYPELLLWSKAMVAIQSRDVSDLLKFGTNTTQAAAQVLSLQNDPVKCSLTSFGKIELQGLAILRLNGIKIDFIDNAISKTIADPLNHFAVGDNPLELMKSKDPFIKEIACLRGISNLLRHESMLYTAFDRDEQLSLDIITQLRDSSYF